MTQSQQPPQSLPRCQLHLPFHPIHLEVCAWHHQLQGMAGEAGAGWQPVQPRQRRQEQRARLTQNVHADGEENGGGEVGGVEGEGVCGEGGGEESGGEGGTKGGVEGGVTKEGRRDALHSKQPIHRFHRHLSTHACGLETQWPSQIGEGCSGGDGGEIGKACEHSRIQPMHPAHPHFSDQGLELNAQYTLHVDDAGVNVGGGGGPIHRCCSAVHRAVTTIEQPLSQRLCHIFSQLAVWWHHPEGCQYA